MKAIIVDDDSFIRQVLRMMLSELKIDVVNESASLEAAKSAIAEQLFDVAFLDIMLPDGSGMDLIKEVKDTRPDAKILMISGTATKEKVQEAVTQGANGFIVKPFNANVVVKNIANSLNIPVPDEYGT